MKPWDLIVSVDWACEGPVIIALFTQDGRYVGTFDTTGSSLTSEEQEQVKKDLRNYPPYIGPESMKNWFGNEND